MNTATVSDDQHLDQINKVCHHCGETCDADAIVSEDLVFCCQGCQLVYSLLADNNLDNYYQLATQPGAKARAERSVDYGFLDDEDIQHQLLDYHDANRHQLRLHLPQIHCSACVWLLEHLYKLLPGIVSSRINFVQRTAAIVYDPRELSLKELVEMLDRIGYAPELQLHQLDEQQKSNTNTQLYYRLGVAGFAFGNIMLLSFPEYLGLNDAAFIRLFGYLNILLALPVLLYAAYDYWHSAWLSLRQGHFNMDVPITLGMLALFSRSVYGILSHTDAGYLDSLAGLVFFLLIGKWFQQRTYQHLSFERDYKSYFPLAVRVKNNNETISQPLDKVKVGDVIVIKNGELIPTDSLLLKGTARIDYSFVTGEADPVRCAIGDKVFAGGRQKGEILEVCVQKTVNQSYLTQLWNDSAFAQQESQQTRLADQVGRWFTFFILAVAITSGVYWLFQDAEKAINAFSAVLIIACPCAIALSIPFTYGNMLRWLGRQSFYLKNVTVIERLQEVTAIVFDKTGTLTDSKNMQVDFLGIPLNKEEQQWIKSLAAASSHPLSQQLSRYFSGATSVPLHDFQEFTGKGTKAIIGGQEIRLGNASFMQTPPGTCPDMTNVFVEVAGQVRGVFTFRQSLRPGIADLLLALQSAYTTYLLSGDQDQEASSFQQLFAQDSNLHFRQQPQDKLNFIKSLQAQGERVMMIGDGLNDAGALRQADIGLVVTDDTNNFSPACDGILESSKLPYLTSYISFSKRGKQVLYASYALALGYNIIGLTFAVQAQLSPVIAAILMPLSSITIVAFGVLMSSWFGQKMTKVTQGNNESQQSSG